MGTWTVLGAQALGMGGAWISLETVGGMLVARECMWDHLRDEECGLAGGQASRDKGGEASQGPVLETLNARLRGGEVVPVNFHYWPRCPRLTQGSHAASPSIAD